MRSVCYLLLVLGLTISTVAIAAPIMADGCPVRAEGSKCVTVGGKYDVSDADPTMDASRHLQVQFSGDSVASPGVCGAGVTHVTNILWRYVPGSSCP
jgi:hypothetical protein